MNVRQLQATVRGHVQAVGFRWFVVGQAERLGLTGWVQNGSDGRTVQVVAEGAADALEQLIEALRTGPPAARVETLDATWSETTDGYSAFEFRGP